MFFSNISAANDSSFEVSLPSPYHREMYGPTGWAEKYKFGAVQFNAVWDNSQEDVFKYLLTRLSSISLTHLGDRSLNLRAWNGSRRFSVKSDSISMHRYFMKTLGDVDEFITIIKNS